MFGWIEEKINDSDELSRWVHEKYGMRLIIRKIFNLKKMHFTRCSQRCLIESKKQLMIVMKYEGKCIKTI